MRPVLSTFIQCNNGSWIKESPMKETWKFVDGYNSRYKVSSLGRVCSLCSSKPKLLQKFLDKHGYETVYLYNGSKKSRKMHMVHRLVAQAFIPNLENKPHVNHKDGCPTHNYVSNLEWVTRSENIRHAIDVLHRKPGKCIPVKCIETGEIFESQRAASLALGLSRNSVCIALGKRVKNCNTAAGKHFERV